MNLCSDSLKILNTPNAGGNSIISETLSNEILFRSFNSKLLATEMEIIYYPTGKITDYAVKIHDTNFGVSVTRAMKYPPNSPYTEEDAKRLLKKKLEGVIASTKLAIKPKFKKQILHIWAINSQAAESLEKAYADIDPEIKSNTIVLVTIAENCDFIFWNSSQINNNHNNQNQNQQQNSNTNTNSNSNSNNMKNQNQEMFKNHILDSSLIKEKSEEKNIHRSSESTEESNTEDISNRESTSFNSSSLQRSMSFYPSKIHILTQNSDDCTAFWDLFNMNKPPTKYADQKTNSINPDEEPKLMRIYRIGKGKTRSIECIKEGRWDQISKCVLETSFCYVVDTKNELFIWMGNGANSSQRKLVVKFGKAIKLLLSRPSSCFSMIVIENKEHVLFKEKFYDFSTRFSNNLYSNLFDEMNKKKSTQNNEDNTIQKLSTDFCSNEVVSKVIKDFINRTENPLKKTTQKTTQKKKIDAQKSNLCVWVINKETREIEEFDNEMYGHFFSNDNYLVFFRNE
eukprot:Anaeramoba_ignava/c20961_g1_i1.p1 GENE.c20961_g1_i1~~c20961_g1_i1.p1  ORF type:complete len:512 (-),score=163.97 c20961_g1_i1:1329-2864(-)